MKALYVFAQQTAVQQSTLVKRRVLQLFRHLHTAVTAHAPAQSPQGQGHGLPLWRHKRQDLALRCEAQRQELVALWCLTLNVVDDRRAAILQRAA